MVYGLKEIANLLEGKGLDPSTHTTWLIIILISSFMDFMRFSSGLYELVYMYGIHRLIHSCVGGEQRGSVVYNLKNIYISCFYLITFKFLMNFLSFKYSNIVTHGENFVITKCHKSILQDEK